MSKGIKIFRGISWLLFGTRKRNSHYKKSKWDLFLVPLYALIIAVLFRSLVFDNFHVPSGSMKGTLLVGDKITISKFWYGYSRYSFPFGLIPFSGRIIQQHNFERGDVVVFKLPTDKRTNYVKRLIGLPGDTIQVQKGILHINGSAIHRCLTSSFVDDITNIEVKRYIETMPNGKKYLVLDEKPNFIADDTPEYKVPEGHYFFMGDNRDNSQDSRFASVGFVSEDLLLGRVEKILISSDGSLLNPLTWLHIRWGRVFNDPDSIASSLKCVDKV
jgi:signal peptidase I